MEGIKESHWNPERLARLLDEDSGDEMEVDNIADRLQPKTNELPAFLPTKPPVSFIFQHVMSFNIT